jgi:hypothetical protein
VRHRLASILVFSTLTFIGGNFASIASASDSAAILVNGGDSAEANECDFYDDLHQMSDVLKGWKQVELAADGDHPGDAPNGTACIPGSTQTPYDTDGFAVMKHYQEPGALAATTGNLRQQILSAVAGPNPPKRLLLYFTDHGADGEVDLWGQTVKVEDMQDLIKLIPNQTQLILVHDHCFSGSMLESLFSDSGSVRPNSCGFAASGPKELTETGQSIANHIDHSPSSPDFPDSNKRLSQTLKAMRWDQSFQSSPTATSDVYLQKYFENHPSSTSCATCFTPSAIDAVLQTMDSPHKTMLNVLLLPELQSLDSDLARAFKEAGVDPKTSLAGVQNLANMQEQDFLKVCKKIDDAYDKLGSAVGAFVISNLGQAKYDRFSDLDYRLDTLRDALETEDDPKKKQALTDQIKAIEPEYADLSGQIGRIKSSVDNDNPKQFEDFVAAGAKNKLWPANSFKDYNASSAQAEKLSIAEKPYLTLANLLEKKEALSQMITNKDSSSVLEYLGILECENTDLRQPS